MATARAASRLFAAGVTLAVLPTALLSYLLMPFPLSQRLESLAFAHALHATSTAIEATGVVVAAGAAVAILRTRRDRRARIGVGLATAVVAAVLILVPRLPARRMFLPPERVSFAHGTSAALPPETLVLGVVDGARASAYPIRLLAYHHLAVDDQGNAHLLPTY